MCSQFLSSYLKHAQCLAHLKADNLVAAKQNLETMLQAALNDTACGGKAGSHEIMSKVENVATPKLENDAMPKLESVAMSNVLMSTPVNLLQRRVKLEAERNC